MELSIKKLLSPGDKVMVLIRTKYGTKRKTGYLIQDTMFVDEKNSVSIECIKVGSEKLTIDNNIMPLNLGGLFKLMSNYKYFAEYLQLNDGTLLPLSVVNTELKCLTNTDKVIALSNMKSTLISYSQEDPNTKAIQKMVIVSFIIVGLTSLALCYISYLMYSSPESLPNLFEGIKKVVSEGIVEGFKSVQDAGQVIQNPGI